MGWHFFKIKKEVTMILTFVGDIFSANLPYNRGLGVAATFGDDIDNKRKKLCSLFHGSDLVFGNLESPILFESDFNINQQFAGHPDFLELLKSVGVGIVTIANNHIMEHSSDGFISTLKNLDDKKMSYVGVKDNVGLSNIQIVEIKGIKLAFVAYNQIDNKDSDLCGTYSKDNVLKSINEIKEMDVDFIIVSLHWGDEYIHRPAPWQIDDAHSFIDAGANFIIGSHPHVIQPIEEYKGALICYSLGNFIFDMAVPKNAKWGMVLNIEIQEDMHYSYSTKCVILQEDFFPKEKSSDLITRLLDSQKKQMDNADTLQYLNDYLKEAKRRRTHKRIIEKGILLKNWLKYTPSVRKEFRDYYLKKVF